MGTTDILIAGLVGTTLMTIFSKIAGILLSKEFSEPKLLDELMRPYLKYASKNNFMGWLTHYVIGIFFAWGIWFYAYFSNSDYTYVMGIVLGGLLGGLGVLGWSVLMVVLKKPPKLDVPAFLIQLVFAHIVFGLGVVMVYKNF